MVNLDDLKNLQNWTLYGGRVEFSYVESCTAVMVKISDNGGCAPGWSNELPNFIDALLWAEGKAESIIAANKDIVEMYLDGQIPCSDAEEMKVTGHKPFLMKKNN